MILTDKQLKEIAARVEAIIAIRSPAEHLTATYESQKDVEPLLANVRILRRALELSCLDCDEYAQSKKEGDLAQAYIAEAEAEIAALKESPITAGLPPTAAGAGLGFLADVEGFSTEALMTQKGAEKKKESPKQEEPDLTTAYLYGVGKGKDYTKVVLEAARLWGLQKAADAADHAIRYSQSRDAFWLDTTEPLRSVDFATRANALEAWAGSRKGKEVEP